MTGPSGPADGARGASSVATPAVMAEDPPSRSNGPRPSTAAYKVAPSDQRSDAGVAAAPRTRSGAVKPGVPTTMPAWVMPGSSANVAMPKSVSTVRPSSVTSTLLGLTSRCSTPAACALASAPTQAGPELGRLERRQRAVLDDDPVQGAGVDELHHDPGTAVLRHHVEHRHDARVAEPGRGPGLAQRPLVDDLGVGGGGERGDLNFLHGDVPGEQFVAAAPDDAHGAAADRPLQTVTARDQAAAAHNCVHGGTLSTADAQCPVRRMRI